MQTARVNPGDVLGGKYKVERILGAGGMGIVVAAKHIDLGQRVALKFMLKEAMTDPAHAERFLREAKSAVQLKSVHTARVLDVGRLKNGEPFMVMEYLDGRDLDAELHARGPLPPHVAVDYILQASEALAEAHGLGVVHRDIKLKNLFLTAGIDGRPLVKVLDFGLAKTIGEHGDVSLTAANSVFGSPQYMSPEQMRSAKDVDFRSDIWSMGVCLYELLTGRVPFDAQGVAEICAMVLKDPVVPPSQLVHGLPPDLEQVVLKCLEKDVTRRFQSIAELAFALESCGAHTGSARRILHVMQTVSKVDHPTIVNVPPALDAVGKTMNAWDSVVQAKRTNQLFSRPAIVILSVSVLMALIGAGAIAVVMMKRSASLESAATAPQVAPTDSPAPPPTVDPSTLSPVPPAPAASAEALPPADTSEPTGAAPESTAAAQANTRPTNTARPKVPSSPATTKPPNAPTTPKPSTPPKNRPGSGADYM